jgi:ribose/xylose/arabinose/galactoside ABC-type transport system permease subunit
MSRVSLVAHFVWEGVLLLAAVVVTALGVAEGPVFAGPGPWPMLAILGTLTAALALSLRTGTPNLAVASIASLAGVLYGALVVDGWQVVPAAVVAVLAAFVFGVVLALVTGLTGAPAWAVSLGGVTLATTVGLAGGVIPRILAGGQIAAGWLTGFAGLFVVGSLAGGVLWLVPAVRLGLGGATRNGPPPGLGRRLLTALVGLGGSSLVAGLAGVLEAGRLAAANFTGSQLELLVALGAALLGGVSLTGRGGGVAGTVLAVYLLVIVDQLVTVHNGQLWAAVTLPATLAIFVGILVSRLLDYLGTPSDRPPAATPYPPAAYPYPTDPVLPVAGATSSDAAP